MAEGLSNNNSVLGISAGSGERNAFECRRRMVGTMFVIGLIGLVGVVVHDKNIMSPNRKALKRRSTDDLTIQRRLLFFSGDQHYLETRHVKPHDVSHDFVQLLDGYSDISNPFTDPTDLPVFWHVPKCGGSTLITIHQCFGMVLANQVGILDGHEQDSQIAIVDHPDHNRYVNVDPTTQSGIDRAIHLGLAQSELADVAISSYFVDAAKLFDDEHKGKCFTILRHPIKRAISMYYYLQISTWERDFNPKFLAMSVEEYVLSYAEDNWMVRMLTNNMNQILKRDDLELAKNILGRKCIVGLMDDFEESIRRYDQYFGWTERSERSSEDIATCIDRNLHGGGVNTNHHPKHDEGSQIWNMFMEKNKWDMELYMYAKDVLFMDQENMF